MKKLFLLFTLWIPCVLYGQLMDTTTIFRENFEAIDPQVSTSYTTSLGGTAGDWVLNNTLSNSPTHSFHTPVYSVSGNSTATTEAIPLTSSEVGDVNYVYLSFDQICKINSLDNATIYYATATGIDGEGNFNWGAWQLLNFNSASPFYYGSGTYNAGKFNDACYSTWNSSNLNAVPTNAWWKNEYLDISSPNSAHPIIAPGVTHFRLQFRCNKTSPPSSGTNACAGWYLDNLNVLLSNCELIKPTITLTAPLYVGSNNNTLNNIGPYNITANIFDNDTLNLNSLVFTYRINDGTLDTIPNTITSNVLNASGHTVKGLWTLPNICYGDSIYYYIYVKDTHGSSQQFATSLTAHHNYTNIRQNDCRLDNLNDFPFCLITGVAQNVTTYFTNRSDAAHSLSTGSELQTALSITLKVENSNHVVTHNSTHPWTGSLCFDETDSLSLLTFIPTRGFNYVTVYVNSRNGQTDGNHANDTLRYTGYACDSVLHGDYTIGGTNPDFVDMAEARASLTYCGVNGPTTFHLRPGTYQDCDFAANYVGQSDVNTITFMGDDVNSVIVTNNNTDAGANLYGAVTLVNVRNFRFKNLTLQGNNTAISRGVVIRGNSSADIIFDGCHITAYPTNNTATTSCAVSRTIAPNSQPDTVTFQNCTITGGNFGIYYYGSNTRKNNITIQNCNVTSCYRGIYTYYCNPTIQGNHVSQTDNGNNNYQNFSGIYVDYAAGVDINGNTIDNTSDVEYGIYLRYATLSDFYIRNNRVKVGNTNFGIYIGNSSSTTGANGITGFVYNNEVIVYPIVAAASYAMKIETCNLLKVANNSLFVKSDAPYSNTAALMIQNNNTTYLDNNLLINQCNSTDNTNYPIYLNNTSTIDGDYNDYVSSSGIIGYKTVTRNTIAEWESAFTTTANNISFLPPMVDPTDSLLPTDFTGLECALYPNVTSDIRGIVRNGLTYMGAYANSIANTDAAITSLTNPASGTCPEDSYNITVSIANSGSEALSFAVHPMSVKVLSAALNLNQTVTVNSGSIALLSSINQIVANNVTIPVNQNLDFTFIITTAGDNNPLNDTLRTTFILEAAIPDYEEDFSNGAQQTWTIEQISGAGNWAFQEGTGSNPAISPVYGTGRLFFNSNSFSNSTESRAVMPVVVLEDATNPILEMWMSQDNGYNASTYATEGVTVKISTDGGVTYSNLIPEEQTTALVKRYNATAGAAGTWSLFTYDLSSYVTDGCVHIAFDARSRSGNSINLDRIRLRNLYNNDIAVTQLYDQGETPAQLSMKNVVSALIRNEGYQDQTNIDVYLNVTGATEQYTDTVTIPSLVSGQETLITFPDHLYNQTEVKNVEVRAENDEMNNNNAGNRRMVTTTNIANYADTAAVGLKSGDYTAVIRPCVRYKVNQELAVTAVKYYYDATYIQNPEEGFQAFVSNADGHIVASSDVIHFNTLQNGNWYTIPINNFALTNMTGEFYVGISMSSFGDYLCSQIETPLRDSTFFYLEADGTYTPQTFGRFMIGAAVDTPYTQDLGILSLQNPVSTCDLGHENITLEITNNGSSMILPGTSMHYTVNNGNVVTETIQDTILSHETFSFAFNTIYDFTNNLTEYDSTYLIKVWATAVTGDRLPYNDTLNTAIVSMGKAAMPIVDDTVFVNYHTTGTITPQMPASISQGIFGWYTNSGFETWDFKGYGDSYTTPEIFFDTTYYVTANPGYLFDTIVGTGTASGAQPFIFTSGYSRGRILYTQEEIGSYGPITTIGVYVQSAANGEDGIPIKIYLKETDLSILPNQADFDWGTESNGAQLIVDEMVFFNAQGWHYFTLPTPFQYQSGNLMVLTETNCADYCTGTMTQCNNCGNFVSGGSGYPSFRATAVSNGYVQYKNANATQSNPRPLDSPNGTYTNYPRRLNMEFKIANVACGSEKVPVYIHVPDLPNYDVQTDSLVFPTGGCTMGSENIQVRITNLLNTPIPANKVVVHAVFNGTEISQTVNEEIGAQSVKYVTFDTPFDFSAPTANITFHYTVYTTLNNETIVFRHNDTITGSFVSNYTFAVPAVINYTSGYTETFTVQPTTLGTHYYYTNENDNTPFYTGASYTTPALYDSLTLWVSGKTTPGNCETERIRVNINVFTPQYDLITNELVSPVSFQCGVTNSPHIQVNVGNTDTTSSSTIPNGTFELTAQFTGTNTATGTTTVTTPLSSLQNSTITFGNGINIGSNTQNNSYTYHIYSDPTNDQGVYRGNDTISGTLFIPANPVTPPALNYTTTYGNTYTVTPNSTILDYYYFYHNANDAEPLAEGNSFVTDPLYAANTTYYYSGRIEDADFDTTYQVGNGNANQQTPFAFTMGHSAAMVLYSADEIGGIAGRIDSIYINIATENTSGATIPIKLWLKNVPNTSQIANSAQNINWDNMKNGAQLILDANLGFDHTGWYGILIPGGFDYTGGGLYLLTEHNCGSASCVTTNGINPIPNLKTTSIQKKVLLKSSNTEITGTQNFALNNYRPNTIFKFNYTCESPKGTITIHTSVPTQDVGVTAITTPVPSNNNYTNNEQVQVTIKNFGSQAVSNIPVNYQLGNNAVVTQTYSGSLASNASATITFTTPVDLTPIYYATPFKSFTALSGDGFHNNDTITMTVSKEDPCISRPLTLETGADISNVTISNINNGSGTPFLNYNPLPNNGLYTDYTASVEPILLGLGQTYPLAITHSFTTATATNVYKRVFIDYNRDGDFEDEDENVFTSDIIHNTPADATTSTSITIPNTASIGLTRMRVICVAGNFNNPCGTYNYAGETEDYAVNLAQPYPTDLGIVSYQHPVGNVCPDTAGKIRIIVKNFGQSTQSFSGPEPLTLTATVTGPIPGTYTVSKSSGSLAANEQTVLIMDNVNLSVAGTYHLTTLLTYNGDQYYFNDTMSTTAVVAGTIMSLPFTDNFDLNTGTDVLHFTGDWTLDNSSSGYKWEVFEGASPNSAYNAGPDGDHTQAGTLQAEYGRYAFVKGVNNNYNTSNPAWTSITTGCLDLHYHNGYPVEVNFYKHFLGTSNADFLMTVEVGSGEYFIKMDTLTKADGTQILSSDPWSYNNTTLTGYDEVGRVKLKVTNQKYRIDPSIDDLNITPGLPDLAVTSVRYPYDFRDTIEHPDACLIYHDSIHPIVKIQNKGFTPISDYSIMCIAKIGTIFDTVIEHPTTMLNPGDTLLYTFETPFVVPEEGYYLEVSLYALVDLDKDASNNTKRIISCTSVGTEPYEMDKGVVLHQNVPNPAINKTRITYLLPDFGTAKINIYSTTGQLLYSESQEGIMGENSIDIPTSNLAAGIYYYTLEYKNVLLTKKMAIQK